MNDLGNFNIDNLNFQWGEEGIFGMSLTPVLDDGYRVLHFSPLASNREFAVSTEILHNSSKTEDSYHDFYAAPERGAVILFIYVSRSFNSPTFHQLSLKYRFVKAV